MQALIRGRILLMIDGVSYAIITPANIMLLLNQQRIMSTHSLLARWNDYSELSGY